MTKRIVTVDTSFSVFDLVNQNDPSNIVFTNQELEIAWGGIFRKRLEKKQVSATVHTGFITKDDVASTLEHYTSVERFGVDVSLWLQASKSNVKTPHILKPPTALSYVNESFLIIYHDANYAIGLVTHKYVSTSDGRSNFHGIVVTNPNHVKRIQIHLDEFASHQIDQSNI